MSYSQPSFEDFTVKETPGNQSFSCCPLMDSDARAILAKLGSPSGQGGVESDGTIMVSALKATETEQGDNRAQERQRLIDRTVDAVLNLATESERLRSWLIIHDGMRRAYRSAGPNASVADCEAACRSFIGDVNGALGNRGSITTPPFPAGIENAIRRAHNPPPDTILNVEVRQGGALRISGQSASFWRSPQHN